MFVSIIHDLFTRAEGTGGTFSSTFLTFGTEILHSEVNGFIRKKGEVGRYNCCLKTWSKKRMKHTVTNSTHLSQTCPEEDRGDYDLVIPCVVCSRRITQPTDVVSKDASDKA